MCACVYVFPLMAKHDNDGTCFSNGTGISSHQATKPVQINGQLIPHKKDALLQYPNLWNTKKEPPTIVQKQ